MSTPPSACIHHQPICVICFEDLKPIAEDLQVIPNCGHVFHELCLQQWLEYCPEGKRPTCPFCKQFCGRDHPTRLYFQSVGDPTQMPPLTPPPEVNAEALGEEVKRLEAKISSFTSMLENQQSQIKNLDHELSDWKDAANRAEAKKQEIRKEKDRAEQLLRIRTEELSRRSSECSKLEERSLGLAKELAALKLATDLNLGEEDMMKLASLGQGGNPENALQVLRKSLALRNKSYKELMAQCNLLGRSETRAHQKLDKTKDTMKKLKTRLQELEKSLEEKENGIIRDLKPSYRWETKDCNSGGVEEKLAIPNGRNCSLEDLTGKPVEALPKWNQINLSRYQTSNSMPSVNGFGFQNDLDTSAFVNGVTDLETDSCFVIGKENLEFSPSSYNPPVTVSDFENDPQFDKNAKLSTADVSSVHHKRLDGSSSSSHIRMSIDDGSTEISLERESQIAEANCPVKVFDSVCKQKPPITVRKETPLGHPASSGDCSFPGGILGTEGANRSMSKWCKRTREKVPFEASTSDGNLIAVGADGRGGRVKVLRANDQIFDSRSQSLWPKRQKHGEKQTGQSNIEHFFGRAKS